MARVLLDEHLDHRLRRHFREGHDVRTVEEMGWKGQKNGALLRLAERHGFDALLTNDKGIRYQQNLDRFELEVLRLDAATNKLRDTAREMPRINRQLRELEQSRENDKDREI